MPGLEDLYREIILDHYRNPRNRGQLDAPPALKGEGFNPLCGDEINLYIELDGDVVRDVRFDGQGCSISQASASMLMERIEGLTVDKVKQFSAREMLELFGARLTPNRQKCCLLSWRVVQSAMFSPVNGQPGQADSSQLSPGPKEDSP